MEGEGKGRRRAKGRGKGRGNLRRKVGEREIFWPLHFFCKHSCPEQTQCERMTTN